MTCGVCTRRSRRQFIADVGLLPADSPPEISGTWDFVWPRGTKIRVAFQRISEMPLESDTFHDAIKEFKKRAKEWEEAIEQGLAGDGKTSGAKRRPDEGISFDFGPSWILDPPLGAAISRPDQNRSSFDPAEPLRKP